MRLVPEEGLEQSGVGTFENRAGNGYRDPMGPPYTALYLDPESFSANRNLGYACYFARQYRKRVKEEAGQSNEKSNLRNQH
jgi:hypothetical protein